MPNIETANIKPEDVRRGTLLTAMDLNSSLRSGTRTAEWVMTFTTHALRVEKVTTKQNGDYAFVVKRMERGYTDEARFEFKPAFGFDGKTSTLVVAADCWLEETVIVPTAEERRATLVESARSTLNESRDFANSVLALRVKDLHDEDGNFSLDSMLYAIEWGSRIEDIIEARTVLRAIEQVERIVAKQEAGEAFGDIVDAIEFVEADYEQAARRTMRTVSSGSTNGWANAVTHATAMAYAKVGQGAMRNRWASPYDNGPRYDAAAKVLNPNR